jgi:hypothetical protein
VRTIVDDANVYDHLKLMARFVRLAGYGGLMVCLDELVNLYKLPHAQARMSNYEQILRIVNDSLQGSAEGCGWVFGGTPEFLLDPRRGLFSYPALASRLEENRFANAGLVDLSGPVVRLASLTPEDLYVLLTKLRHVHAGGDPARYSVPDEALAAFMQHAARRIGDAYFRTPRTTIRAFVDLLAVLEQNPEVAWTDLIERVDIKPETNPTQLATTVPTTRTPMRTMTTNSPAFVSGNASAAFDLLDETVRRWVWEQHWTELRDVQEAAIRAILPGNRDVILSAATASGKTEAAFLPDPDAPRPGPASKQQSGVLYVSPLKALINDQFRRLELLCERLDIP